MDVLGDARLLRVPALFQQLDREPPKLLCPSVEADLQLDSALVMRLDQTVILQKRNDCPPNREGRLSLFEDAAALLLDQPEPKVVELRKRGLVVLDQRLAEETQSGLSIFNCNNGC